jgi:hypothetical protein
MIALYRPFLVIRKQTKDWGFYLCFHDFQAQIILFKDGVMRTSLYLSIFHLFHRMCIKINLIKSHEESTGSLAIILRQSERTFTF